VCAVSGYGNLVPRSTGARVFCCFYAILGIPLCLIIIVALGDKMRMAINCVKRRITCTLTLSGGQRCRRCVTVVTLAETIIGFTIFLLLPPVIFKIIEGWDYATGLYFSVVTLTTIGFGDYVAGA